MNSLDCKNGGLSPASGDLKLTCRDGFGKASNFGGNSMKRESSFGRERSDKLCISEISEKKSKFVKCK